MKMENKRLIIANIITSIVVLGLMLTSSMSAYIGFLDLPRMYDRLIAAAVLFIALSLALILIARKETLIGCFFTMIYIMLVLPVFAN